MIAANSACEQHLNQAVKDIAPPTAFTGGAVTQTALSHPLTLPLCHFGSAALSLGTASVCVDL